MNTTALLASIDAEIARLTQARNLLSDTAPASPGKKKPGRPKGTKTASVQPKTKTAGKRTLSPEARARIVAGQKARWAGKKKGK